MHVCYLAVAPLSHMWHPRPPHSFLLTWLKHLLLLPAGFFFFFLNEAVDTSCPQDFPRVILGLKKLFFSSLAKACFCSVTNSCLTLCGHTDCCRSGFPVLHYLLEFAQTHVHWFGIAIQPSHPLSPPSSLALNLSQHQNGFQWVGSSHQVARVLERQHQSFQWIFRIDYLWNWLVWSPCSPRDSQESSPAPQFKSISCLGLS